MANFVFDLDGTLIDSYPSIIDKLIRINDVLKVHYSYEEIFSKIIKSSTGNYIDFLCEKNGISRDEYQMIYDQTKADLNLITLFDDSVAQTLADLSRQGDKLFIYTHRGQSVYAVLENLGIRKYFIEIVDSTKGFKRKPSGEGITYLVNKYNLDPKETYYVGDRELDILAAIDAGVCSIFFNSSGINCQSTPTYSIDKFIELKNLLKHN